MRMRRRDLILGLGGSIALPLAVRAQKKGDADDRLHERRLRDLLTLPGSSRRSARVYAKPAISRVGT